MSVPIYSEQRNYVGVIVEHSDVNPCLFISQSEETLLKSFKVNVKHVIQERLLVY
jgi:hypothetical protein